MAVTPRTLQQAHRHLKLATPLGTDVLVLRRMEGHEKLSALFRLELDTLSTDPAVSYDAILGQNVTVTLDLANGGKRHFNGFVSRFELHGFDGQFAHYRAVVVPWLWFLTRTSDCRIFQNKAVPDIIQGIFREHGFTDFEDALSGDYQPFEYVTQYRETDFNFVSRLMEREGIYYFFRHEEGKHTLVLADSYDAHQACPGYEEIPYYPPDAERVLRDQDYVWDWQTRQEIRTGIYALNDYDFTAPKKNLLTNDTIPRQHEYAEYERYDYPGGYREKNDGERYSQIRMEERQTDFMIGQGQGNVRGLLAGGLCTLANYPRQDQNREYLITTVTHRVESDPMETGRGETEDFYRCDFSVIDAQTPFRPPHATPKPGVRGPHTAVVVGKAGEDIWTDKYGRVKVQFHWDREGQNDENSSCWVRVSHNWAGKNWGGMFMPHIGHEVIVDFLEGDPDRPIITGRVYNADNMPPEELPSHQTKSFIRDYGDNEMVWEGKEGEQFIRINQKCGNQLIMNGKPGEESVSMSDKFGNLLLLDSANEMIALRSPSKTSGIVLGKSIHEFTESDTFKHTGGSSVEAFVGNTAKLEVGSKVGAVLGSKMEVFVGTKFDAAAAYSVEVAAGSKMTFGGATTYSKSADSHMVDSDKKVVLDAAESVWVLGGKDDASIISADQQKLSMSYSSKSKGRDPVDLSYKDVAPSLLGPLGHLVGIGAHALGGHGGDLVEPYKAAEKPPVWDRTAAEAEAYGAAALSVVGTAVGGAVGWWMAKNKKAQVNTREGQIGEHESPDAKINLEESGVTIEAGKCSIDVKKDSNIGIYAENEIVIRSRSGKTIEMKGDKALFKAAIEQKNLIVSD